MFWANASDEEQQRDDRNDSPDRYETAETEHLEMRL